MNLLKEKQLTATAKIEHMIAPNNEFISIKKRVADDIANPHISHFRQEDFNDRLNLLK